MCKVKRRDVDVKSRVSVEEVMIGLVERLIIGIVLGGRGLSFLCSRKFGKVEVVNVKVRPDRSMVAT